MRMGRGYCQTVGALAACMIASVTLPGCFFGASDATNGTVVPERVSKPISDAGEHQQSDGVISESTDGTGDAKDTSTEATESAPDVVGDGRTIASRDENLSYAEDKEMVFSNNKILLFAEDGSYTDSVVRALQKYGTVDATNASSGMYVVEINGHRESDELARMIEDIVKSEPLIEAGSINWTLPDQPGTSDKQQVASEGAPKVAPEKVD